MYLDDKEDLWKEYKIKGGHEILASKLTEFNLSDLAISLKNGEMRNMLRFSVLGVSVIHDTMSIKFKETEDILEVNIGDYLVVNKLTEILENMSEDEFESILL